MQFYYTAREAQQQLGMSVGAFYYLVDTGKIQKLAPHGKKQGFYSKHQIERLAKEQPSGQPGEQAVDITFMQATLDDIPEEYELAVLMLNGSAGYGLPSYEARLRKNVATNFLVRDQGRLVAFMHVLPVEQSRIRRWLNGEIKEWEIRAEDVLPCTPLSSVEYIILSMVTASDVDPRKRRLYGLCLIRGFLQFSYSLARRGITISRLYAAGKTPEAVNLLARAGFKENDRLGKRVMFEFDPLTAQTRTAKLYRSALKSHTIH